MDESRAARIERKLDIMTRLVAVLVTRELKQREQISVLDRVGLAPREIAEFVGTSANTVRVELVHIRRHKKGRKDSGLLANEE